MQANPQTIVGVQAMLNADQNLDRTQTRNILALLNGESGGRRKMISLKEAGRIIGCHPYTVRKYAQRGHLTQVSLSARKKRYFLDEVERFAVEGISLGANA